MSETNTAALLIRKDMATPSVLNVGQGTATVFTTRCIGKQTPNEDAVGVLSINGRRGVLVVADGFGGQPAGDQAAELALTAVIEAVELSSAAGGDAQSGILAGLDRANELVKGLGVGAATTLAAVEIEGTRIRPYHVGDSEVLVVGQRGRVKLRTISHSPVGYRVEAGLINQEEAIQHEERHIVSNMVGSDEMRIDVGPTVELRPRDTVVIASDGLFDNLMVDEIAGVIRKGNLLASTQQLVERCQGRMNGAMGEPFKPDDLSVVVFRPSGSVIGGRRRPRYGT